MKTAFAFLLVLVAAVLPVTASADDSADYGPKWTECGGPPKYVSDIASLQNDALMTTVVNALLCISDKHGGEHVNMWRTYDETIKIELQSIQSVLTPPLLDDYMRNLLSTAVDKTDANIARDKAAEQAAKDAENAKTEADNKAYAARMAALHSSAKYKAENQKAYQRNQKAESDAAAEYAKFGHWHHNGGTEVTAIHAGSAELRNFLKHRGMPCHATSSTYGDESIVILYYGCIEGGNDGEGPGVLGSESYTWRNGHLMGQTNL